MTWKLRALSLVLKVVVLTLLFSLLGLAQKPTVVLKGKVVTPSEVIGDGFVAMSGEKIQAVGLARDIPAGSTVVETNGIIFPGLIDLHDHIVWNVFPRWQHNVEFPTALRVAGTPLLRHCSFNPAYQVVRGRHGLPHESLWRGESNRWGSQFHRRDTRPIQTRCKRRSKNRPHHAAQAASAGVHRGRGSGPSVNSSCRFGCAESGRWPPWRPVLPAVPLAAARLFRQTSSRRWPSRAGPQSHARSVAPTSPTAPAPILPVSFRCSRHCHAAGD